MPFSALVLKYDLIKVKTYSDLIFEMQIMLMFCQISE